MGNRSNPRKAAISQASAPGSRRRAGQDKYAQRIEKFCLAYVIDLNGAKAAELAGYSKKTARVTASKLLTKPNIQARIAELTKKQTDKLDITAERVLRELALLAYANMDDYVDIRNGTRVLNTAKPTRDQMAAVQEIIQDTTGDGETRTRFKLADKGVNLERLGRHLKLFADRLEIPGLEGLAEAIQDGRKRAAFLEEPKVG